jgi:hypothetical protein
MTTSPDPTDDPAVTGVPPETPDDVRPSATGLVTGPLDGPTDVEVADVTTGSSTSDAADGAALDQLLEDAEGGIEGSTLDAPDS